MSMGTWKSGGLSRFNAGAGGGSNRRSNANSNGSPEGRVLLPATPSTAAKAARNNPFALIQSLTLCYHVAIGALAIAELTGHEKMMTAWVWARVSTGGLGLVAAWIVLYTARYVNCFGLDRVQCHSGTHKHFVAFSVHAVIFSALLFRFQTTWTHDEISTWENVRGIHTLIDASTIDLRIPIVWYTYMLFEVVGLVFECLLVYYALNSGTASSAATHEYSAATSDDYTESEP